MAYMGFRASFRDRNLSAIEATQTLYVITNIYYTYLFSEGSEYIYHLNDQIRKYPNDFFNIDFPFDLIGLPRVSEIISDSDKLYIDIWNMSPDIIIKGSSDRDNTLSRATNALQEIKRIKERLQENEQNEEDSIDMQLQRLFESELIRELADLSNDNFGSISTTFRGHLTRARMGRILSLLLSPKIKELEVAYRSEDLFIEDRR